MTAKEMKALALMVKEFTFFHDHEIMDAKASSVPRGRLARSVGRVCQAHNNNFDWSKFMAACVPEEDIDGETL